MEVVVLIYILNIFPKLGHGGSAIPLSVEIVTFYKAYSSIFFML